MLPLGIRELGGHFFKACGDQEQEILIQFPSDLVDCKGQVEKREKQESVAS